MKNIFKIFILFFLFSLIKNEIRIPFKSKLYSKNFSKILTKEELEEYLLNLIHNDIYIELEIGTPTQQKIQSFLKFEEYPFFILGKDISSSMYNQSNSLTYKTELYPHVFLDGEEQIKWGYVSNDSILINNKKDNSKILTKEFSFILVTETKTKSPSNIGLMIPNQYSSIPDISFITQLKKQELINDYSFIINYTSIDKGEGEFIIGGPPHSYNKKYNQKYFRKKNAINKPKYIMYGLEFDLINYGNNISNIGGVMTCKFLSDFGLIVGSNNYYEIIFETFFKDKLSKGLCYKNIIKLTIEWRIGEKNYEYFYCEKKVDISELKNIRFIHKEMNFIFEFNYKELFQEIDNLYIFKIIFTKSQNFYWIFGKLWLAKYLMVFNQDTKTIGHYYYISDNLKEENNQNKNEINITLLVCIIVLGIIFIFLCLYYFIYFFKKDNRKIRLNEINDEYEYEYNQDKNNNNNKGNLLFLF